jgi:hypothetical protein
MLVSDVLAVVAAVDVKIRLGDSEDKTVVVVVCEVDVLVVVDIVVDFVAVIDEVEVIFRIVLCCWSVFFTVTACSVVVIIFMAKELMQSSDSSANKQTSFSQLTVSQLFAIDS